MAHLAGDNARERRFAQTRRAVEQNVIERIPPLPGGLNVDVQAVLHRLLSHVFTQGFGAETAFLIIFFLADKAVFLGVIEIADFAQLLFQIDAQNVQIVAEIIQRCVLVAQFHVDKTQQHDGFFGQFHHNASLVCLLVRVNRSGAGPA